MSNILLIGVLGVLFFVTIGYWVALSVNHRRAWKQAGEQMGLDYKGTFNPIFGRLRLIGTHRGREMKLWGQRWNRRRGTGSSRHNLGVEIELDHPLWKGVTISEYSVPVLFINLFRGNPGFDTGDKEVDEYFEIRGDLSEEQKKMLSTTEVQEALRELGENYKRVNVENGRIHYMEYKIPGAPDADDLQEFADRATERARKFEQMGRKALNNNQPDNSPDDASDGPMFEEIEPEPEPTAQW